MYIDGVEMKMDKCMKNYVYLINDKNQGSILFQ